MRGLPRNALDIKYKSCGHFFVFVLFRELDKADRGVNGGFVVVLEQ